MLFVWPTGQDYRFWETVELLVGCGVCTVAGPENLDGGTGIIGAQGFWAAYRDYGLCALE